jgi:hypothetical protein
MTAVTFSFDTLEFTRRLKRAGFDEAQAETVVKVITEAQLGLVTKEHFDARIEVLELKSDGKFNLLHWMLAFNLAFTLAVLWKMFGH